ncbi:MAG: hypothetical protein MUC63_01555, partial [Planctomycetes bacterium]|nr:hypothetical protein [Planctomycetota bacterium]
LASLDVRCIAALPGAVAPSSFVAGTAAGLCRSDDGGATWTAVSSTGLYNAAISAVCVQSATTLFASTLGGGVYLYDSAAATPWTQRSAGLTDLMVTALVSHATLPTLYAGTETAGVFTSVDSGVTWTKANTNQLPSLEVLALAVDPNSANRCWVSTALGLRYTQNGGNAWVAPGTAPADAHLVSLLSDPVDSDDVYAGGFSGGAYFCTNATGGRTFAAQKTGLIATDLRSFAADATGRLYAGGGFDGANQTSSGIFGSNDAAVTWAASTFAPPRCDVRAFAPHPTANQAYVAVENGGVWFTNNGGGTWSQTWSAANDDVAALALVSTGPDTLIAGLVAGGVLRTVDGGTNWSAATGVAGTASVWDFSFEPGSTTNVWAATSDGVYRSTDGGATWTRTAGQPQAEDTGGTLADVDPLCVQVDPDTTLTVPVVYAGTELHGIFASTDGGLTFHAANQHVEGAANVRVFDFCARTTAPYGVYAATSVGLYRTRSQGGDWNPIHSDDATITDPLKRRITTGQAIALMPTDPAVLWVATGGRGVLRITLLVP